MLSLYNGFLVFDRSENKAMNNKVCSHKTPLVFSKLGLLLLFFMKSRGSNTCVFTRLVDKRVCQTQHEEDSQIVTMKMAVFPMTLLWPGFYSWALCMASNHGEIHQENLVPFTVR